MELSCIAPALTIRLVDVAVHVSGVALETVVAVRLIGSILVPVSVASTVAGASSSLRVSSSSGASASSAGGFIIVVGRRGCRVVGILFFRHDYSWMWCVFCGERYTTLPLSRRTTTL